MDMKGLKPQSAADGACPLIAAGLHPNVNSGDFFMPDQIDDVPPMPVVQV